MGSGGKKKTTMAKLAREQRLRERRLIKEAKREARKYASDHPDLGEGPVEGATGEGLDEAGMAQPLPADSGPETVDPAVDAPAPADREQPTDPREQEVALLRLRDTPDETLALFEGKLRSDAQEAGASEQQIRHAQRNHPGHGA